MTGHLNLSYKKRQILCTEYSLYPREKKKEKEKEKVQNKTQEKGIIRKRKMM